MATSWMVVSGFLGAMSNLCMRRSMDKNGSARAFFVFQLFFTCLVTILLHPVRTGSYGWNSQIALMGLCGGIFLGSMKWMLGKALQRGPAGLTFAAVNSASVMPAIVMVLALGSTLNYELTPHDLAGSILVLMGLFWAGWDKSEKPKTRAWILFAASAFLLHVLFLVLTEFRAIFLNKHFPNMDNWLINPEKMASEWFVPTIFAAAAGMHAVIYCISEKRIPIMWEVLWGILGGIFNGACAFFFMRAAETATMRESSFIFAIFSISLIIVCNLWGQWLYNEKVNWKANTLCLIGVLLAAQR
ncbi:MAG: hypothetical protein K940chlam7_00791 [Chlamydiae bacterium]|nr:hypothetical protein [Chlamydiota bacterium]